MKNKLKENKDKILDLETKLKKLLTEEKIDDTSEKSYDSHGFDEDGFYKDTDRRYDPNGFNKDGFYKDTNNKYNSKGFDINGKHKDTIDLFDSNGFNIYGLHKDANNKYNPNGLMYMAYIKILMIYMILMGLI